jgi:hypothetical protein
VNPFPGRRRSIQKCALTAPRGAVSVSEEKKDEEVQVPNETRQEAPVLKRGLCPKCKAKPNHYFHVKHCKA